MLDNFEVKPVIWKLALSGETWIAKQKALIYRKKPLAGDRGLMTLVRVSEALQVWDRHLGKAAWFF